MGKGGEQAVSKQSSSRKVPLKLEHMQTEELRKWAKAYGVHGEDRKVLLEELVSLSCEVLERFACINADIHFVFHICNLEPLC